MLAGYRQPLDQSQVLARVRRQFHDDRDLPLREVELGESLVVVARGGDAQGVGDRDRGHAEIGRTREVRPHDQFGPHQASARRHAADARDGAQLALDLARMLGEHGAVFAGQHQHVLLLCAGEPDGDAGAGQLRQRGAQFAFDLLLAGAAPLTARRHVDRQRRLARLGRAARLERIGARRAAADCGVDQLHMRILLDDRAGLLGARKRLLEGSCPAAA